MAYQIEYSEAIWSGRRRRKAFLRLFLLALLAGAAYGVYDVYTTYNKPTLNMKLADYEAVVLPIEEMNAAWDAAAKDYDTMLRYYRLLWAASPTNFLSTIASTNALHIGKFLHPVSWTLKTGGECKLDFVYSFNFGDKAEQTKGLEDELVHAVTSVVDVAGGKVDVQGVQHENLLDVDELNVSIRFSLPNVKPFPVKERTLADCVKEIAAMRKKVQETPFMKAGDAKGDPTTALALMTKPYIEIGRDAEGRPDHKNAIDIMGWLRNADKFIDGAGAKSGKKAPDSDVKRRQHLKDVWNKIGEARFPWDRFRVLDNDELVVRTKDLGKVSDGVKRFKGFLDQRRADCMRKLEPFVEAYLHNDVFNKPFVMEDLTNRVAKAAGIPRAGAEFRDEQGAEPAVLEKKDEKFTFTWVRWKLSLGVMLGRDGNAGNGSAEPETPLTLENIAECARRAQELGPGYALDVVKIGFAPGGNVVGATLEGLLPVKKVESNKEDETKEAGRNGD